MFTLLEPTIENIHICAKEILKSNLVVMPTETVYGLAGNALDVSAIEKIYKLKNRPLFNPLIAHFYNVSHIKEYCNLEGLALDLANIFMPGALSIVLSKKTNSKIHPICSGNTNKQAVRIPNNHHALQLIQYSNVPLVAPSANVSNKLSPIGAKDVIQSFKEVKFVNNINILDGGNCDFAMESTVVEVVEDKVKILRYGSLSIEDITQAGFNVIKAENNQQNHSLSNLNSPGLLKKHYSPNAKLRLNADDIKPNEALLAFGEINFALAKDTIVLNLSHIGDITEASKNLFPMLWELDRKKVSNIAVMPIPNFGLGLAINDRLSRASYEG
jgi:L-threonylcarbamoyladenylate synthase